MATSPRRPASSKASATPIDIWPAGEKTPLIWGKRCSRFSVICLALARFQSPYSAADEFDLGKLLEHRLQCVELIDCRGGAGDRQHGDDLALAAEVGHQLTGHHLAQFPLADIGVGDGAGAVGETPAGLDGGNAGIDGALEHVGDRAIIDRPVDQEIDVLAQQVFDVGDLLGRVEGGIGDDNVG